jgi:hypothetical protein
MVTCDEQSAIQNKSFSYKAGLDGINPIRTANSLGEAITKTLNRFNAQRQLGQNRHYALNGVGINDILGAVEADSSDIITELELLVAEGNVLIERVDYLRDTDFKRDPIIGQPVDGVPAAAFNTGSSTLILTEMSKYIFFASSDPEYVAALEAQDQVA